MKVLETRRNLNAAIKHVHRGMYFYEYKLAKKKKRKKVERGELHMGTKCNETERLKVRDIGVELVQRTAGRRYCN